MNSRRAYAALLTLPILGLVAGCASSGSVSGAGSVSGSGSPSLSASAGTAGPGAGTSTPDTGSSTSDAGTGTGSASQEPTSASPDTAAETLGAQLQRGVSSARSAHFSLKITASGESVTGSGDEKLADGKLVAVQLGESLPGGAGSISIIVTGGKAYVKLPSSLNRTGKPWLLATTTSSNPVSQAIAKSLSSTLNSASVGSVGAFVNAASSISKVGVQTINGAPATHYHVIVDVAKLASLSPNASNSALIKAGLTSLPVDLWLDPQYRPVLLTENITVASQHVSTSVSISRYNAPVTISAPPAGQVGS